MTTIYRRFDQLSARNLLFLEAEFAEFDAQQNKCDVDDLVVAGYRMPQRLKEIRGLREWKGQDGKHTAEPDSEDGSGVKGKGKLKECRMCGSRKVEQETRWYSSIQMKH